MQVHQLSGQSMKVSNLSNKQSELLRSHRTNISNMSHNKQLLKQQLSFVLMQDGFGAPLDSRKPMSWRSILHEVGARVGNLVTIIVMKFCELGTLETAICRGESMRCYLCACSYSNQLTVRSHLFGIHSHQW